MTSNIGGFHEHDANSVIAGWLNESGRNWRADSERTSTLIGTSERPDIIIRQGDRMPVIIECEYGNPAIGDALKKLNHTLQGETRPFTEIIAVGIDEECRKDDRSSLRQRLDNNDRILTIQLVYVGNTIWPDKPMPSTPADLAAHCEYAQVPQAVIDSQSENIAQQIVSAGQKLQASIHTTGHRQQETLTRLREIVGCQEDEQATRTACAIWLIAIDLQNDLATHSPVLQEANLETTRELKSKSNNILRQDGLLQSWRTIEEVNYLPVMDLAINSLEAGAMGDALTDVLFLVEQLSTDLNGLHAKHIYNFAGELWQRLGGDREERAEHYTKPEIAELLATLSALRFQDRDAEEIAVLNLMDAACGTGTLIGAGERALRRLYYLKNGQEPKLHRNRMEEHIIALDVNGIAGTLTAKRLTDMDVTQDYSKSKIAVVTHPAGSLSLLDPKITGITDYLGYGGVSATPGLNKELGLFHVAHGSIHWSLMNPPFSRPFKGRIQATKGLERLRPIAAKAGWKMSHGQAGLASDFGNMSNMRMAPQGAFAHVLPLTAAHAGSWKSWRAELEKDFTNIVAIANVASTELQSMSADTGMSEMLVVATKRSQRPRQWSPAEILCVNLNSAPASMAQGYAMAQEIASIPPDSKRGILTHGQYTRMPQNEAGFPWGSVGNSNNEMSEVGISLLQGRAFDPVTLETHQLSLQMVNLGKMAGSGPTHDLIGHPTGGDGRGAFEWTPLSELQTKPVQQSMWAADGKGQTIIATTPTHGGTIVDNDQAKTMVGKRSQWFLSRNIRWTSQAVAAVRTTKPAHGGRAWNALQALSKDVGQCIVLYYNSVFGAMVRNA